MFTSRRVAQKFNCPWKSDCVQILVPTEEIVVKTHDIALVAKDFNLSRQN